MQPLKTPVYGIDTSVFVRLITAHPRTDYEKAKASLQQMRERNPAMTIVVSNQVIGETYITLQFHYPFSKVQARAALIKVLEKGAILPQNGQPVIDLLRAEGGAGLMVRLIAQDYDAHGLRILTNDRKMAQLEGVELLSSR